MRCLALLAGRRALYHWPSRHRCPCDGFGLAEAGTVAFYPHWQCIGQSRQARQGQQEHITHLCRGHRRGPNRIYGEHRIGLAKRAGQTRRWATGTFDQYGKPTAKKYKTFVPLYAFGRPSGNYNRPWNACSTWRLDSHDVAPRADL
jgi:hypothetical protein